VGILNWYVLVHQVIKLAQSLRRSPIWKNIFVAAKYEISRGRLCNAKGLVVPPGLLQTDNWYYGQCRESSRFQLMICPIPDWNPCLLANPKTCCHTAVAAVWTVWEPLRVVNKLLAPKLVFWGKHWSESDQFIWFPKRAIGFTALSRRSYPPEMRGRGRWTLIDPSYNSQQLLRAWSLVKSRWR